MRLLLATPLLLSLLAPAAEAAAQTPPTGADVALKVTVARALLEEGQKLLAAGRLSHAREKLEASIRNDPTPAAMLALSACQERLGLTASAWGDLQRAAREARLRGDMATAADADKRALAIVPRLSKVKVVAPRGAPDLEISLDGQRFPEEAWNTEVPLDPGEHKLLARSSSGKRLAKHFELEADGSTLVVNVPDLDPPLERKPTKPYPSPPSSSLSQGSGRPPASSSMETAGATLLITGLVGFSAGVGFALAGLGYGGGGGDGGWLGAGLITMAGGAVITGVGVPIYLAGSSRRNRSGISARVGPVALGSGAGLGLHGTW